MKEVEPSQHSPGPWQVMPEEAGHDYIRVRGTRIGERFKIADVACGPFEGYPRKTRHSELAEARANAQLVASAPELLAALQASHTLLEHLLWGATDVASAALIRQQRQVNKVLLEPLNPQRSKA